jgi:hypothetical protein
MMQLLQSCNFSTIAAINDRKLVDNVAPTDSVDKGGKLHCSYKKCNKNWQLRIKLLVLLLAAEVDLNT